MHSTRSLWAVLAWLALMLAPLAATAAEPVARSVLILDESAGAAAGPFYASIVSSLRSHLNQDPSKHVSIFVEHLDLSRFRGPVYEKALNTYLQSKYSDKPVGVI